MLDAVILLRPLCPTTECTYLHGCATACTGDENGSLQTGGTVDNS